MVGVSLSNSGEVFNLEEALRLYPLVNENGAPIEDAIINLREAAAVLKTSENTVTSWKDDPSFPVLEEGGNGKGYKFRLSEVYAWGAWRKDAAARSAARVSESLAAARKSLFGEDELRPDGPIVLSARQRREETEAEVAWMRMAQQRRELVSAREVQAWCEEVAILFAAIARAAQDEYADDAPDGRDLDLVERVLDNMSHKFVAHLERGFSPASEDRLTA